MKSIIYIYPLIFLTLLSVELLHAQVPQAFSYQAVARDASGDIISNSQIGVRVQIIQGSSDGNVIYSETHSPMTSDIGSFTLEIGRGNTESNFSNIDWMNGPHYLSLAVDITGGTSFVDLGASKLLSVPFALVAGNSSNQTSSVVSSETSNIGFSGEVNIGDSNNFDQRGIQGIVRGNGKGSHIGVFGSVVNLDAPAGETATGGIARKYGIYGQAASKAQENLGLFAIAAGAGSGDIQADLGPNPGSVNSGVVGFATGNLNFNLGVRGRTYGSAGARENVGVQGSAEVNASGRNIGVQSFASRSQTRNIGYSGNIGFEGSTPENYGMLLYVKRGGISIGAEIHADRAIVTYGNAEINGDLTYSGSLTQTSDINLKEKIRPITHGLDIVMKLNPSSYYFKRNNNELGLKQSNRQHYGLIAQEVEVFLPSLVVSNTHRYRVEETNPESMTPDGLENQVTKELEYKSLNYTELIPFLIKAIQEQQDMITQQQRDIVELRQKLESNK